MTQDEAFKAWWYSEGSQAPYTHHDCEEHTMRMCEIAWANGAYKEREFIGLAAEDRLTAKYMQDAPDGIEAVIDYIEAKLKELNT